jgi:putative PEP-CTERM system TPR-repeat lipoprotein
MICPKFEAAPPCAGIIRGTLGSLLPVRSASVLRLLLVLACIAWGGFSSAQAASFLERAQQHFEDGDLRAADVELKNALQREPNNAEARFLLGKVHLKLGDPSSAEKEFLRSRELGYADDELDLFLAYARLQQQRFRDVIGGISDLTEIESAIQKDLFVARGEALMGLGQLEDAEAVFDRVLESGPHARALVGKAQVAAFIGDQAGARSLLDRAKALAPDEAFLVLADAEWLQREQRFEESKKQFARAIKLDPSQLRPYLGKLQVHIALREIEDARSMLTHLKSAAPDHLVVMIQEAVLELITGNIVQAKTIADRVLSMRSDLPQALMISGLSAYELEEYEQARARLMQYLSLRPEDNQARMTLGATLLKLGYSDEAYATLRGVPDAVPDVADYLAVLTNAAVETGDIEAAHDYLERLVVQKPNDPDLRRRLAVARVATRDLEGGAVAFEESLELAPDNLEVYAQLFSVRMQLDDAGEALEVAQRVQSQFPSRSAGHTLSGIAHLALGDRDRAKQAFREATEVEPDNPEAAGNLARLLTLEGEIDSARVVFERALTAQPGHLPTLLAYAELETSAGDVGKAENLLEAAVELNQEAETPRIKLAILKLQRGSPAETLQLTEPILIKGVRSRELLETVGLARFETGDHKGALDIFEDMVAADPNDPKAHEYRMLALERNGLTPEALSAAERVLELDPNVTPARFARVRYLAQLGRMDEAKAALQPLKEEFSDDVHILVVEGRIALAEGRFDAADEALERAFTLRRNNKLLVELVRAKMMTQRREEGIALMQEWLQEYPEDLFVRTTLADSYIKSGEFQDAKDQLSSVIERAPNDPRSKVSMAKVLLELGSNEEATRYAQQAYEMDPGNPAVADMLGVSLLRSGKKQEALRVLIAAREAGGGSKAIRLHLSEALAENGQRERAIAELEELLQEERDFPERAAAEKLLGTLQQ